MYYVHLFKYSVNIGLYCLSLIYWCHYLIHKSGPVLKIKYYILYMNVWHKKIEYHYSCSGSLCMHSISHQPYKM